MTTDVAAAPGKLDRIEAGFARIEWPLAIVAAVVAATGWVIASRDIWFFADAWDFVARREFGSIDGWLDPHIGHLQIPAFLLHRLLYGAVELDYYPWYLIPHAVGYSAVCLLLWRSMLWRGADRLVAFAAFLLILFIGTAEIIFSTVIGAVLTLSGLALLAMWMDGTRVPSRYPRLAMTGVLFVLVATGSTGVIIAGSAGLIALFSKERRRWLPAFIPPGAAYLLWWFTRAVDSSRNNIDLGALATFPRDLVEIIGLAIGRAAGLPDGARWIVGVGVVALIGWLGWKARLRAGEALYLLTAFGFIAAVLLIRVAEGVNLGLNRYSIFLALYLIVGLAPVLRWPAARWTVPVLAVAVLVVGYAVVVNASNRVDRLEDRGTDISEARVGFDAVAQLIADGEPLVDVRVDRLGDFKGMSLRVTSVRMFVEDGYRPPEPADPELLEALRPLVRFEVVRGARPDALPISAAGVGDNGCVVILPGDVLQATARAYGNVRIGAGDGPAGVVDVTWTDDFGVVGRSVEVDGSVRVVFPEPVAEATLVTIGVPEGSPRVNVCGVAPGP